MRYKPVNFIVFLLLLTSSFSLDGLSGIRHLTPEAKNSSPLVERRISTNQYDVCDSTFPPHADFFCPTQGIYSYFLGITYRQIIALPFLAPMMRIDSLQFYTRDIGGNNLVKIQLFESNLPYPSDLCRECKKPWGYFINSNDTTGVAAYPDEATDTAWTSCTTDSTWYPFGKSLLTIQSFQVQPNHWNTIILDDYVPGGLPTDKVQELYLVIENIGNGTGEPDTTNFMAFETETQYSDCPFDFGGFPVLKFYRQPASFPEGACRGWWERGLIGVVACNGVLTGDYPPGIATVTEVPERILSSAPQGVDAYMMDCNFAHPESAGVASAVLDYVINSVQAYHLQMTQSSTNDWEWSATIPSEPLGTSIEYNVVATDFTGNTTTSSSYGYKIINLESAFFRCDTMYNCENLGIASTGTVIDTSEFFLPPLPTGSGWIAHKGDDGTAGPFSLGGPFIYFGDTMHYAWVGVNGALALSKSPTDTIDVNASGFFTDSWTFPGEIRHGRGDTTHPGGLPENFIAPFWADWCQVQDSPFATSGHIRRYSDSTKFIIEWDSLGSIDPFSGLMVNDIESFRVIIDRSWNTVEFQYDNVGYGGLDTTNLTGIQGDTTLIHDSLPAANFYNKHSRPGQTRLYDGSCVRYVPIFHSTNATAGWSFVSFPVRSPNMSFRFICPTCTGPGFIFKNDTQYLGYVPTFDSIVPGLGYWVKFSGAGLMGLPGVPVYSLDIPVYRGWNAIGSIGVPVPIANITADAGVFTGSPTYFSYSGGYFTADQITPGYGYWVRANSAGNIHMTGGGVPKAISAIAELNRLHRITISQKNQSSGQTLYIGSGSVDAGRYELPPGPPDGSFDVRFASNRMVEIYPGVLDPSRSYEYPITINASDHPLTVRWEDAPETREQVTLMLKSQSGNILALMNGTGKITLNDPEIKRVIVAVTPPGNALPKVFALGRNYPNPYNPTTRFSVDVPRTTQIEVSVFDILGRKIATVWNGEKPAGYHTLEWTGQTDEGLAAPTGMYFIRMTAAAEKFSTIQKTMLIR